MRTKLLILAAAGMMAMGTGSGVLVGCSGSGTSSSYHPAASQLKEGVNLLDVKDPTWGTNTAFVQNGRVVYLETRVGPMKPDVYRQSWPEDPANEMDMRFVDQNGYTFYVMRGGDSLIDPTWSAEMAKTKSANLQVPMADRELDWKIAKAGAQAVSAALSADFKDHVFHLAQFGERPVPSEDPLMKADEAKILATPIPAELQAGYGSLSYGGSAYLETQKFSAGTTCAFWTCPAKHSATRMWYYTSGWNFAIEANNHGRNATQLGYDCYSVGGWFGNAYLNGSTAGGATGSGDGQGGCQTAYSWNSGGYNHLCNDDAAYELWQAKQGSQWTGLGYENGDAIGFQWYGSSHGGWGQSPSYFACNCSSFGGCGGDWNTPECP